MKVCTYCDQEFDETQVEYQVRHYPATETAEALEETLCQGCESMDIDDIFAYLEQRVEYWRADKDSFPTDIEIADWLVGIADTIREFAGDELMKKYKNLAELVKVG